MDDKGFEKPSTIHLSRFSQSAAGSISVSLWAPQPALKVDCFSKRAARLLDKLTQLQPCTGLDRFARNRQRAELVTYSTHTTHTERRARLQALYETQDCVKQRQGVRRKNMRAAFLDIYNIPSSLDKQLRGKL